MYRTRYRVDIHLVDSNYIFRVDWQAKANFFFSVGQTNIVSITDCSSRSDRLMTYRLYLYNENIGFLFVFTWLELHRKMGRTAESWEPKERDPIDRRVHLAINNQSLDMIVHSWV